MGWKKLRLVFAILGIFISLYALNHHFQIKVFGKTNALCNLNELFSCDRVANSEFSEIFGTPLAVYGLGYFSSVLAVILTGNLVTYHFLVLVGLLTTLVLACISIFGVGALCITCISIYVVNFLQAAVLFIYSRRTKVSFFGNALVKGGLLSLAITVMAIAFYWSVSSQVMEFLKEPKYCSQVRHFFIRTLRMKPKTIPLQLEASENLPGDIWVGNKNAKVTVVEFIDHLCPMCQDFAPLLDKAIEEFGKEILVVLKQYPKSKSCNRFVRSGGHGFTCESAALAFCTAKRGKYWAYQKAVFHSLLNPSIDNKLIGPPAPGYLIGAREVGLTNEEIEQCLSDENILKKLSQDIELAMSIDFPGTPGIYVNGWNLSEIRNYEFLKYEIQEQLKISKN